MTSKIEELASKTMGAAKAAKAAFEGLDGVFRQLIRDHGEVSALLLRLKFSHDPSTRQELWQSIRKQLLAHEQAEKTAVYPAFLEEPDTREMAHDHAQDASDLEDAIAELSATSTASEAWQPTLERLIQLVEEHVQDEEEEYFPIADRVFKDRSDDMLARFEKAKAEALRQLDSSS